MDVWQNVHVLPAHQGLESAFAAASRILGKGQTSRGGIERVVPVVEDVLDGGIRAVDAGTAVHEDGFRQIPPGIKHGGKLMVVQRRTPAFFHRNVADAKSRDFIELDQGGSRIQPDLIFGAEADDGLDADGADGIEPELQSTHGNGHGLAARVTGPRRAVESVGDHCEHRARRGGQSAVFGSQLSAGRGLCVINGKSPVASHL